jgi:hypothetical protein
MIHNAMTARETIESDVEVTDIVLQKMTSTPPEGKRYPLFPDSRAY